MKKKFKSEFELIKSNNKKQKVLYLINSIFKRQSRSKALYKHDALKTNQNPL